MVETFGSEYAPYRGYNRCGSLTRPCPCLSPCMLNRDPRLHATHVVRLTPRRVWLMDVHHRRLQLCYAGYTGPEAVA